MAVIMSLDDLRRGKVLRGEAISMRAFDVNGRASVRSETDEVLYVLERDEGIYLPAGAELELQGKLTVAAVGAPSARRLVRRRPGGRRTSRPAAGAPVFIHLRDVPVQRTGDRWYRELIQSEITQFVGSIPPGRAPDHFHLYEEVLCILQGSGFLWAGTSKTPMSPGSCAYLPRKQVHCLENTSSGELRLLGVFYPAGSPAARYEVSEGADRTPGERQSHRRR